MSTKFMFVALFMLALSLVFVSAQNQDITELPLDGVLHSGNQNNGGFLVGSQAPVQIAPNDPSVVINLVSPNSNSVLETRTSLNVEFNFVVTAYDFNEGDYPLSCYISLSNGEILDAVLNEATGVGTVQYSLPLGDYSWRVTCASNSGTVWTSNSNNFAIRLHVAQVELGEPSIIISNSNPSVSNEQEEESNGRRRVQNSLPLTPLSTTPETQESNDESSGLAKITGAVVGTFGKKGTLGIGIFIVVVGIAGLLVYNREYLGIVKAK